ncbi:hypothetical protein [Mucilaginibacter sp.]|jgi:hypothetical protein|uniref:hypothetical protein n=1 Tax=Mucilaginibacter sp. TaxID=1882438 RepID=UPI00356AA281
MSSRTLQTEEIQSLTGVILASSESRYAISGTLGIDDLAGNENVTKDMLLAAIGFLYPTPVYLTVGTGTQLSSVTNDEGETTWAYRIDYEDPAFFNFGLIPTVAVLRGLTCNFVSWFCDGVNLDIYLPDYNDTGETTESYSLKIAL